MAEERRKHRRVSHPLEATWAGSSGATRCRIGDISQGGCFVQCLAAPSPGERTTVSFSVGDRVYSVGGRVVYCEPSMGFAVRFEAMAADDHEALGKAIETL